MNILQSGICNIILADGTDSTQKYSKALMNTILVMGTVLAVLIFIAILVYLIKFIPAITKQNKSNETTFLPVIQANTISAIYKEEELVNDSELVAVITAAIMASMGVDAPVDGLFVKSIKRANVKRWQNA